MAKLVFTSALTLHSYWPDWVFHMVPHRYLSTHQAIQKSSLQSDDCFLQSQKVTDSPVQSFLLIDALSQKIIQI